VLVVEDSADDVELLLMAAKTAPEAVSFYVVGDGKAAVAYLEGEGQYADRQAHPFPAPQVQRADGVCLDRFG
jgi:hypothetical protein